MTILESFGKRLRELRQESGLNQIQLAEKLGMSRGSISFYENADRMPDLNLLERAAEFFDVTIDYLLGKSENRNPSYSDICKMLGLSDRTIETIVTASPEKKDIIDKILKNDRFDRFLVHAEKYYDMVSLGPERYCRIGHRATPPDIDYTRFLLAKEFIAILKDIAITSSMIETEGE